MRNYSTTIFGKKQSFVTSVIGAEYYTGNPVEVLAEVITALADAFESEWKAVRTACSYAAVAASLDGEKLQNFLLSFEDPLCPSEMKVITDLFQFFKSAEFAWNNYFKAPNGAQVFVYVNLNTGKTVSWTVLVG